MDFNKINELVATKVMGWHKYTPEGFDYTEWRDGKNKDEWNGFVDDFNPSEDIRYAWEVAKKLGLAMIPQSNDSGIYNWFVCDVESVTYRGDEIAIAPIDGTEHSQVSAPLAICLAALESVGVDVEALQDESDDK